MFEMVIGEMDMILGSMDEEKEFESIIMEIWAEAKDNEDAEKKFSELGEQMVEAKKQYIKHKKLDESLFGSDFGS